MPGKKEELEKKRKEAEKMYRAGVKLVEIAKKIGKPAGTVRRWKNEQNWDEKEANVRKEKSERSEMEREIEKGLKEEGKKEGGRGREKSAALNEKEKLFCQYYAKVFNATDAYQWAYGCKRNTAAANGHKLLKKTEIQEEIKALKTGWITQSLLEKPDIVEQYIKIAFSDIGAYIEKIENQTVYIKDLDEVDTSIIKEIKNTQNGVCVKLKDQEKALEWLADHWGLMTEEQKARVEMMKKQAEAGAEEEEGAAVIVLAEVKEDGKE